MILPKTIAQNEFAFLSQFPPETIMTHDIIEKLRFSFGYVSWKANSQVYDTTSYNPPPKKKELWTKK